MSTIEVKVPDIGDFKDVPVIEVFVKAGDSVKAEDPLVTLESDKATMDVPSPSGGVVKELKLKVGDKVSEGSVIAMLDTAEATAAKPAPTSPPHSGHSRNQSDGQLWHHPRLRPSSRKGDRATHGPQATSAHGHQRSLTSTQPGPASRNIPPGRPVFVPPTFQAGAASASLRRPVMGASDRLCK